MNIAVVGRNAEHWIQDNLSAIRNQIAREDYANAVHIHECDGCDECDQLVEFYSGCSTCGIIGHKSAMFYTPETGDFTCDKCLERK